MCEIHKRVKYAGGCSREGPGSKRGNHIIIFFFFWNTGIILQAFNISLKSVFIPLHKNATWHGRHAQIDFSTRYFRALKCSPHILKNIIIIILVVSLYE